MDWDDDISAMALSDLEKDGLQVYRNYQRSFENHAEKLLAEEINNEQFDTDDLEKVLRLIVNEDVRFVPVIACAYADERLKAMYRDEVPDDIPGGKSKLLGSFGPFGDLYKRLQLAFVFEMLSRDLAADFDRLRDARNELSHTWDLAKLEGFFERGKVSDIYPVDSLLNDRPDWITTDASELDSPQAFRVRVIWLVARLAYEAPLFSRVRHSRLQPYKALYGPNQPKRLATISLLAMRATRDVVTGANLND